MTPIDVDHLEPRWKSKMLAIHEMKNKAEADRMKEASK